MRPVINFLNRVKNEKEAQEEGEEDGPLQRKLKSSTEAPISEVKTRDRFTAPKIVEKKKPASEQLQRIQYERPLEKVNCIKKILRVRTFKEVGERTFDYFYKSEIEE